MHASLRISRALGKAGRERERGREREDTGPLCGNNRVTEYTNGNPRCERRQKPLSSNGRARGDGSCQFTLSDRDYLPLFLFTLPRWRRALVRPRRYPICETDGSDRSVKPIVTLIHLPNPHDFPSILSFSLSFSPLCPFSWSYRTRDHRWIPRFGTWIISGRYSILVTLSNLFQISIAVPPNRQFINSYYNRQDLESDFHCVFNWIPY